MIKRKPTLESRVARLEKLISEKKNLKNESLLGLTRDIEDLWETEYASEGYDEDTVVDIIEDVMEDLIEDYGYDEDVILNRENNILRKLRMLASMADEGCHKRRRI